MRLRLPVGFGVIDRALLPPAPHASGYEPPAPASSSGRNSSTKPHGSSAASATCMALSPGAGACGRSVPRGCSFAPDGTPGSSEGDHLGQLPRLEHLQPRPTRGFSETGDDPGRRAAPTPATRSGPPRTAAAAGPRKPERLQLGQVAQRRPQVRLLLLAHPISPLHDQPAVLPMKAAFSLWVRPRRLARPLGGRPRFRLRPRWPRRASPRAAAGPRPGMCLCSPLACGTRTTGGGRRATTRPGPPGRGLSRGYHHLGHEPPGLEVLQEPPHAALVSAGDHGEGHGQVVERVGRQEQGEPAQM